MAIPLAGNVTFADSLLACPTSSNFKDEYGGRYGVRNATSAAGPFPVVSAYCAPDGSSTQILCSALQFQCSPCVDGTYSLANGTASGTPGDVSPNVCLPCPVGGSCQNGGVVSLPGYWGAVVTSGASSSSSSSPPTISFRLCPSGYCCDSDADSPASACVSIDSCRAGRTGTLCGDCVSGFVESLGSTQCVPVTQCDNDMAVAWPVIVVAVGVLAWVQLTIVSAVWRPAAPGDYPSGKFKLAVYFAQVSG